MSELQFLIHNLADLAPDYDHRQHYRIVDIMVEHWAEEHYVTYNYAEKKLQVQVGLKKALSRN